MIGRLVLSDRNIYKIKSENKQVSARKCYILSEKHNDLLIKTSKEFNSKDEYIKINKSNNTIIEKIGSVSIELDDLEIYYHLITNNWMSNSKYNKLWDIYLSDIISNESKENFDLAKTKRIVYNNEIITIDPNGSIDLDDGFSFYSDELFNYLDIHIADPVSYFDLNNKHMNEIFLEIKKRLQTCYIGNVTHLLPNKIIEIISLLEIKHDLETKSKFEIKSRRAITFCFKVSKNTKLIIDFELKFTNLFNIKNYTYETYNEYLQNNQNLKKELVDVSNNLIKIIGLDDSYYNISQEDNDITHKMIEIFMILTNWYGGNYLLKQPNTIPILRTQNENVDHNNFDPKIIPFYAIPFLSVSANYVLVNEKENKHIHYSLGIENYAHLSSPMRRFIDMINHLQIHQINTLNNINEQDLIIINKTIKNHKKISNAYDLIKFIKKTNKFKACLFDWDIKETDSKKKIYGLLVLYNKENNFVKMVNVELPQIDLTENLKKYMEFDVELYYNSNNFKSTKFPFSIKII
jgi:exoribonuclease R